MVQPEVHAPDGTKRLLDDLVPMEWLYITAGMEEQRWMEGLEDTWRRLEGRRLIILPGDGEGPLGVLSGFAKEIQLFRETDGRFSCWCEITGLNTFLVRPDRYVFAGIRDQTDLLAKVRWIRERL